MNTLIGASLIAFFVLALISPFLPLFLMWRTACLSALSFVTFRLLVAPLHWTGDSLDYALLMVFSILTGLASGFGLVLRLCVAAYFDWLKADILIGRQTRWIDTLLWIALGVVGGILLATGLGYLLGGSSGGRALDLCIGVMASIGLILSFVLARRCYAIAISVGATLVVLAVISFVGSGQSLLILQEAEKMAAGRPWCISIPIWPERQGTMADLGFFSLPKQHGRPYLAIARDGRVETLARWSIRRQRFVERKEDWAACEPQADFRTRLN